MRAGTRSEMESIYAHKKPQKYDVFSPARERSAPPESPARTGDDGFPRV
jgi:hypothetical protein